MLALIGFDNVCMTSLDSDFLDNNAMFTYLRVCAMSLIPKLCLQ